MAPNKFENHIKKELEEREIQPSSDAWSKLSDRLDKTVIERQSKKKGYLWYAVAACLIGLMILSVALFNTTSTISEPNSKVVEGEQKTVEEINDFQKSEIENDVIKVVSTESISKEKKEGSIIKTNVVVVNEEEFSEQLVAAEDDEVKPKLNRVSEEIINTKILQVVAQIDILEQNSEALTDAEVDSLLRKAQTEILTDKLFRSDHSVDAMALLSEVESELDKSFRDQIFESLKSGFVKVRTAVADRNN